MAVKKHGVHFDITAENQADRALRAVENGLQGVNKAADAVGRTLQRAFVATAAIAAGKAFATAAIEAEQASKRLDAVLKATGAAAGLTKDQLDEMADAMAQSTEFDDESLRNAMAQMLKFGNVHGEVFRGAIKLSADLAAFMGTDLNSAVQMIGKALTAPDEGLTALERTVGKFDSATRAAIKTQIEMGNESKAQAMVMDVLAQKVGGAAEVLNTGLNKATKDAKKSWDEMLESIGRTEPFQKVAKSGLNFIEQSFKDIKNIVENGDWVEKTLAIMAFAGGWRGMPLTPQAPAQGSQSSSGRIRNQPNPNRGAMDEDLIGNPMSERDIKAWKDMLEGRKRLAEEAKRKQEERDRENEKVAQAQVDLDEETQRIITEAQEAWQQQRLEQDKKAAEMTAEMWRQVFETIDQEQEAAIREGEILLDSLEEKLKDSDDAARQLGLTFSSAFEDAVVEGKNLRSVLQGLAKDVARIVARKTITEPLADAVTGVIKDSGVTKGLGDFFKNIFRAEGGATPSGVPVMVGEKGPEMRVFSQPSTIIPNDELRRASVGSSGGTYYIDARGADRSGLARLENMIRQLHGSIESRAVGAVLDARRRGGSFAAAFG